jgi:hypothetical protein
MMNDEKILGTCLGWHVVGTEATKEQRSDRVPMVICYWLLVGVAFFGVNCLFNDE